MPITSPVSLTKVKAEFVGPNNLKAYNRGGTYVPNTGANTNVATDPNLLRLSQFLNASGSVTTISLSNHTVYDDDAMGTGIASASVTLNSNGDFTFATDTNGSGTFGAEWKSGSAASSGYEVLATHVSGTAGTGTTGSWLNLGTSRGWTRNHSGFLNGIRTWTFTLQIRAVGTTPILASCTITLQAETYNEDCVVLGSFMEGRRLVDHVQVGDIFTTHRPEDGFLRRAIEKMRAPVMAPAVRLVTASGAGLRCSRTTPFNLQTAKVDQEDGHWKRASEMLGQDVMVVRNGVARWEPVVDLFDIGQHLVQPVSFGGRSFAAGDDPDLLIYSHNMAKQIR